MNHDNTVRQAGGFIIQLMPFTDEKVIDALEKKLSSVKSVTSMLDAGMTPEDILKELLGDFGLEIMEMTETRFACNCSKERMEKALISIGKKRSGRDDPGWRTNRNELSFLQLPLYV